MSSRQIIYDSCLSRYPAGCDWRCASLRDVCEVIGGGTPDTGVAEFWNPPEIPWATPTDITATDGNFIASTARWISRAGARQSSVLPAQSILVTSRATIGAAKINVVEMAINQGFAALVPREGFDTEYLLHLVELLKPALVRLGAGTTFLEASRREIKKLRFLIPPLPEQRRIAGVLKLADEAIAKAQAELDATREVKRSLMATLFVEGIPSRHSGNSDSSLGRIPNGWQVRRIREVLSCPPAAGTSPQSRPEPPGTPILNVSCVGGGLCDPTLVTYVDVSDAEREQYRAAVGDFFVLRGNGNRDYVATGGLLRKDPPEDTIFSDKLIRLRFKDSEVAEKFIPFMWESPAFKARLQSKAESGSGLWMISRRDIVKERFLFPSKAEQEEIVEILESVHASLTAHETKLHALREVKKSLLQNLLTGKIRLPEDL